MTPMPSTLQAWGIEIGGRRHSVMLACPLHSMQLMVCHGGQGRSERQADPSAPRLVRLDRLDALFEGDKWHCYACAWGTQPGEVSPVALAQKWAHSLDDRSARNPNKEN